MIGRYSASEGAVTNVLTGQAVLRLAVCSLVELLVGYVGPGEIRVDQVCSVHVSSVEDFSSQVRPAQVDPAQPGTGQICPLRSAAVRSIPRALARCMLAPLIGLAVR